MSSEQESRIGTVINGKWRLTELLGEGGMGAVFAADGVNGEGQRAIKILHSEYIESPQIRRRFLDEARAVSNLEHPNVVRIYEHAIAEDGSPYLVMERLQGKSLADIRDRTGTIPVQQSVPIIRSVLLALSAAHANNTVHRDLKPDNIFLVPDEFGTVKVLDFGIAKVMDVAGGMGSKTRTGILLGTPGYMSPEQIRNAKTVDHRSDLWSVGAIFFEMLTGHDAFQAPNDFARLTAVLTEDAVSIADVAPHLSNWKNFFEKALARDPNARFPSAQAMIDALLSTAGYPVAPATSPDQNQPRGKGGTVMIQLPQTNSPPPSSASTNSHSRSFRIQPPSTPQPSTPAPTPTAAPPSDAPAVSFNASANATTQSATPPSVNISMPASLPPAMLARSQPPTQPAVPSAAPPSAPASTNYGQYAGGMAANNGTSIAPFASQDTTFTNPQPPPSHAKKNWVLPATIAITAVIVAGICVAIATLVLASK